MVELTREQQVKVLELARHTIASSLSLEPQAHTIELTDEIFREKCGAFVTLHIRGNLRGCIGYIAGVKCIPDTIVDMAISSAFKDPRFMPLSKDEYDRIDIEVSILSPLETVKDVEDIVVGRDGIIISRGFHSGLLLLQVATEQHWDRDTFLSHTCLKAGLPANAWKQEGTRIQKFSAQVFGEKELGLK